METEKETETIKTILINRMGLKNEGKEEPMKTLLVERKSFVFAECQCGNKMEEVMSVSEYMRHNLPMKLNHCEKCEGVF
jgi:dihydroorotate dehydrogenase